MGFILQPREERKSRREPKSAEWNTTVRLRRMKTSKRKGWDLTIRRQPLTAWLEVGLGVGVGRGVNQEEQRNSKWEVKEDMRSQAPMQLQVLNPIRLHL